MARPAGIDAQQIQTAADGTAAGVHRSPERHKIRGLSGRWRRASAVARRTMATADDCFEPPPWRFAPQWRGNGPEHVRERPRLPTGAASRDPSTDRAAPLRRLCTRPSSTTWKRSWLGHPRPTPWATECLSGWSATFGHILSAASWPTGFTQARCEDCHHERLIPFSCKGRGICPSCNARRMCGVAAHLTDHVLPHVPIRQWVLSVPKRLRPYLHHDMRVAGAVLQIFLRAIRTTLRRRSPGAPPDAQLGAVSFFHRFGSSLNLHPHYHLTSPNPTSTAAPSCCSRLSNSSS